MGSWIRWTLLASALFLGAGCAVEAPAVRPEVAGGDASVDDAAQRPDGADAADVADAALAAPCEVVVHTEVHLRPVALSESVGVRLPAGTRLALLAVRDASRRGGVLTRARVVGASTEGYAFVDAADVVRCQRARPALAPRVREERVVRVDGVDEVWRLRYRGPVVRVCDDAERHWCGCQGQMGAEQGVVVLERLRGGAVIDGLDWSATPDGERSHPWAVPRRVVPDDAPDALTDAYLDALPEVTVMDLGDYDHDGRETEFVVESGYLACGHPVSFVVGLSATQPGLHFLGSVDAPAAPMRIERGAGAWERVRASPRGEQVVWGCGDHGLEGTEEAVRWEAVAGRGLRLTPVTYDADTDCRRTGVAR